MVKRTLRPGLGLAERSPLPPWGGRGKLICGGWGRWMRLEFDMRWDLSVLQRCFNHVCSL